MLGRGSRGIWNHQSPRSSTSCHSCVAELLAWLYRLESGAGDTDEALPADAPDSMQRQTGPGEAGHPPYPLLPAN